MTVLDRLQKVALGSFINCHWPVNDSFMTVLWKVSLTGQWQFLAEAMVVGYAGLLKSHWSVNDSFFSRKMVWKTVIDWLMTVLGHQYCLSLWPCVIDSGQWHKIYGHLSLTEVNDRNLWPNLSKSVIDRGQWQKKVSLTGCILYGGSIDVFW